MSRPYLLSIFPALALALYLMAVPAHAASPTAPGEPAPSAPLPGPPAKKHALAAKPAAGQPAANTPASAPAAGPAPLASAPAASTPAPNAAAPSAAAGSATTPPPMTGAQLIQLLDQTVGWYRTLGIQQEAANEPSDQLILYDNKQTANQVIGLAFQIARANADLLAKQPDSQASDDSTASTQTLAQLQRKFTAQGVAVQAELDSNQQRLAKAKLKEKTDLQAKIAELQGELDLINARKSLLSTMATFASQSDSTGSSTLALKAQIDAMAVTLPTSAMSVAGAANPAASNQAAPTATTPTAAATTAVAGASVNAATRFGIWDLASNVIRLSDKIATIDSVEERTGKLKDAFEQLSAPLIDQLKAMSAHGDALAAQADTADSTVLVNVRGQLDALAIQFKQTSALLIPLSKEGMLLNQYSHNLDNWRDAVKVQYRDALKTLGVRLGLLLILLAIVFVAARLWRRAVLRYVQDSRRRYQLLLLRKIALWSLVVLIIGFAFASELGSIVTFAGLITAGLAVAMQSVLVSIVGYFFLIGKYGIRVGDRIQIGEVTGEVINVGLVRMYLMELGGHGLLGPTGRVVAFANSVVFQVSSGLFKQIPGVNFAWHEITLSLPSGIDYAKTKERLMAAVTAGLKDYHDEIILQTREIERTTDSSSGSDTHPKVQLSFSTTGVEAHIRYPVHLQHAAEIDESVSQELSNVVASLAAESDKTASRG